MIRLKSITNIQLYRKILIAFSITLSFTLSGCWLYSFSGATIHPDVKTVQIDYFVNNASIIESSLSNEFTNRLKDYFTQQTNLTLVKTNGDLQFEGEITDYRINPMTATAQQTAAQNRLTININVRFYNAKVEEDNFEKSFSHFYDYPANDLLINDVLQSAFDEILDKIIEDIFNNSVAKW